MVNALARKKAHYGRKIRKELYRMERELSWSGAGGIEPPTPGPEVQSSTIELTPLNHLTPYSYHPTISFIFFKGFIFTAL